MNIKWYLKREGLLDTTESAALDYYLVLTGPPSAALSSRGTTRPWCIQAVFLFDTRQLRSEQIGRYELTRTIDPTHFFPTVGAAVAAFREQFGADWAPAAGEQPS